MITTWLKKVKASVRKLFKDDDDGFDYPYIIY